MRIGRSKRFEKQYKKLPDKLKRRVRDRLTLFLQDPFSSILENHPLQGEYRGFRSINITGDIRIIYEILSKSEVRLALIGTHAELYGT